MPASKSADACTLAIFGASGDLTRRKLIPSLFNLSRANLLPRDLAVVGVASSRALRRRVPPPRDGGDPRALRRLQRPRVRLVHAAPLPLCRRRIRRPGDLRPAGRAPRGDRRASAELAANLLFYLATPPAVLRRDRAPPRRGEARRTRGRRGALDAARGREAVRPRPRVGARARRRDPVGASRSADLPHRPLPRQGDGPEPPRRSASPTASSSRSGTAATSTTCRSPWPRRSASSSARRLLRGRRRAARHGARTTSSSCSALVGDGAARLASRPTRCATRR